MVCTLWYQCHSVWPMCGAIFFRCCCLAGHCCLFFTYIHFLLVSIFADTLVAISLDKEKKHTQNSKREKKKCRPENEPKNPLRLNRFYFLCMCWPFVCFDLWIILVDLMLFSSCVVFLSHLSLSLCFSCVCLRSLKSFSLEPPDELMTQWLWYVHFQHHHLHGLYTLFRAEHFIFAFCFIYVFLVRHSNCFFLSHFIERERYSVTSLLFSANNKSNNTR